MQCSYCTVNPCAIGCQVVFVLLNQQLRVQILALQMFSQLKYRAKCSKNAALIVEPKKI